MKKAELLDLQDFVPYLINRVGTALVARFSTEALERHDLSIAMWRVLLALWDAGTHRQIDLSDQTSIEVSTLSRLIGRLEQRKLAVRVRAKASNREVTIALTPKGRALVQELIPIAQRLEEVAIAHLPPREVDALKATLRRVYANLTG
jgi:MarR family transcriptional regulator, organic hydroperoxide resistance regulator